MRNFLVWWGIASLALAASVGAASAQERPSLLVTPAWLAAHLRDSNLVLLHVGDRDQFQAGHIPGAQFISLSDISVPDMSGMHEMGPGHLMLELPPIEKLTSAFESRGISADSRIVVYFGENQVTPSTRVIWTLAYYGLGGRVSLLDGGMPAWKRGGNEVTSEIKTPTPGKLTPHLHPEFFADAAWVSAHLHQAGLSLIDARTPESYTGRDDRRGSRAGHIPGAENIPIETLIDDRGQLKDAAALEDIFVKAGVKPGNKVVSYCYIGQRATLIWLVAKMLGHDARMYDGSWEDWSARMDLPVEKTANP